MIYKMPGPIWEKVLDKFEDLTEEETPYIDMRRAETDWKYDPIEEYIKHEFGLDYTGDWESDKDEYGDEIDDTILDHYRVIDREKFIWFNLKWN